MIDPTISSPLAVGGIFGGSFPLAFFFSSLTPRLIHHSNRCLARMTGVMLFVFVMCRWNCSGETSSCGSTRRHVASAQHGMRVAFTDASSLSSFGVLVILAPRPRTLIDALLLSRCFLSAFLRSLGVSPSEMGSIVSTVTSLVRRLARGVWNSNAFGAALGGERGLARVGISSSDMEKSMPSIKPP